MFRRLLAIIILVICLGGAGFYLLREKNIEPDMNDSVHGNVNDSSDQTENEPSVTETFDKEQYSLEDPKSLWIIVNKKNSIPINYVPKLAVPDVRLRLSKSEQQMQIDERLLQPLTAMFAAAKKDDVELVFGSGYRSGALQQQFYSSYKARDGQTKADTYSARPGHSEHQTGLSLDVTTPTGKCHLDECFATTKQGQWLKNNAHTYGFIIRYPQDKQDITGYQFEPWHIRFVGTNLAGQIHNSDQTLEEFFELGPATSY